MTVAFLVYYFSIFSLSAGLWTLSRSNLQLPEYAHLRHIGLRGMRPFGYAFTRAPRPDRTQAEQNPRSNAEAFYIRKRPARSSHNPARYRPQVHQH